MSEYLHEGRGIDFLGSGSKANKTIAASDNMTVNPAEPKSTESDLLSATNTLYAPINLDAPRLCIIKTIAEPNSPNSICVHTAKRCNA